MERLDGSSAVPGRYRGGVVALGNFDGFHQGHQAVVGHAVARARATGRPAVVATFDPHPQRFFNPDAPPFRLTSLDQRQRLFAAAGADAMLVFPFDHELASLTAEAFIAERLAALVGASLVVTGEDFTFGQKRGGNAGVLADIGPRYGITAETVGPVSDAGGVISSTRVREALKAGDMAEATRLLTRPFAIEGMVRHGGKLGRTIGYPTANLDVGPYQRPAYGIYAVRARLPDGRRLDGAASLGIRPTFDPPREWLEPFFFDFDGDLYGQTIEVSLIDYLRPEVKFDNLEDLIAQMEQDCLRARAILAP